MSVKVVTSGSQPVKVTASTTPTIKVSNPSVSVISVNPNFTTGQPGPAGPQGGQGPAGNDGVTVTYGISCETGTGSTEQKIRLTGSNSTTDDVVLAVAGDLSIARTSEDKITITNTISNPVLEADTSTSGFQFVVDEDNMSSNSDTKLPTQQSVKAYVDSQVSPINTNVTTNLTFSRDATSVTVISSDGTDAVLPQSSTSQAGVMSAASHTKLANLNALADATDSVNVAAAGAVMDSDFGSEGLMKRNASSGSYSVVANTDGIAEGSSNFYYTETRFNASLNGSSALRDADFSSEGLMKRGGSAGTYSIVTPGTGLAFDGSTIDVSANTTLSVAQNSNDVELKVTGPSGVQSGAITFDAGNNITLTESGNNIISIASTASGGASSLNDLNDVSITGSGANKYLVRDSSNSNYVNQALDISHDTTPTLGGDLVVSGNKIKATGAGQHVDIEADTNNIRLNAAGEIELTPGSGNHINAKGDLDMSGNAIVTTGNNNNITLDPHGTGNVILGNFVFDVDQTVGAGQDNYVLTYDHAGGSGSKISLEPASTASGTVDTNGTPANNQVAVFTDADTIEGQSTFTFDSSSATLSTTNVSAGNATLTGALECQNIRATDDTTELSAIGKTGFGAILAESFGPAATGLGAGKVCVLSTTWAAANAGATGTSITMLGVTTNADSGNMCLQGPVRMSTNAGFSGAAAGSVLYLATSAGRLTTTAPSASGQVVRVCGYVLDASSSIVYFNPSNDWIELV